MLKIHLCSILKFELSSVEHFHYSISKETTLKVKYVKVMNNDEQVQRSRLCQWLWKYDVQQGGALRMCGHRQLGCEEDKPDWSWALLKTLSLLLTTVSFCAL